MHVAQGCRRGPHASLPQKLQRGADQLCQPLFANSLSAFRETEMWVGSLAGPLGQVLYSRASENR